MQNRRDFIRNGLVALSLGVTAPAVLMRTAYAKPAAAEALRRQGARTLVVIELAGGNDILNMAVPYADETYYRVRPTLAIKREEATAITPALALHPAMSPLAELYQAGRVAIVQGVGYPNPNFSHFRAMEIIKSAVPDRYEPIGWLGRFLDLTAGEEVFAAMRQGGTMDHALRGEDTPVPVVQTAQQYSFQTDPRYSGDRQNRLNAFNLLNSGDANGRAMVPLIQDTAQAAYVSSRELAQMVSSYQTTVDYPQQNGLAQGLKLLAQVITADVGLQVGYVTIGGWDTHAGQANQHRNLMTQVATAVHAFQADLDAHGASGRVLVMINSEFGRRVPENGSGGTDHGSATSYFLVGTPVKGGLYGRAPSLTDLDNGNFKYTTDFRSVYATILTDWLRADATAVLGRPWETLGFVA